MAKRISSIVSEWSEFDLYGDGSVMPKYLASAFNSELRKKQRKLNGLNQEIERLDTLQATLGLDQGEEAQQVQSRLEELEEKATSLALYILDAVLYDADLLDDNDHPVRKPSSEQWIALGEVTQGMYLTGITADLEKKAKKRRSPESNSDAG